MAASLPARVGSSAIGWMLAQHLRPTQSWFQRCLQGVRTSYGLPAVHPFAAEAWEHTEHRHDGTPPPAVPVWWTGGKYGHVALSAGGGYCWSNDILNVGRIDKVRIDTITRRWGYQYRGWSADINGYRIWTPTEEDQKAPKAAPKERIVVLSELVEAAKKDPSRPQGKGVHEAGTRIVEQALVREGLLDDRWANDGAFGTKTVKAYARWQKRCGYSGAAADGIPGEKSLKKLAQEHNFKVR